MQEQVEITSLENATKWFLYSLWGDSENPNNIHLVTSVKPEYQPGLEDRKYYQNKYDIGDKDNPFNVPIMQQQDFNMSDKPVAKVIAKQTVNALMIKDFTYYYVTYRKNGWFKGWARMVDHKSYLGTDGVYMPVTVPLHAHDNKAGQTAILVVVFGNGEIWHASMKKVLEWYFKKARAYISGFRQLCIGVPKELFERVI